MSQKCDDHSGLCTKLEDQGKEVDRLKTLNDDQWGEIHKRPTTTTLIVIIGILATSLMGIISLAYNSHQSRMIRLEATDSIMSQKMDDQNKAVLKRMDDQYEKIAEKIDALKDSMKGHRQRKGLNDEPK